MNRYIPIPKTERSYELRAQLNDRKFLRERCAGDPFMADYVPNYPLKMAPSYDEVDTYFTFSSSKASA